MISNIKYVYLKIYSGILLNVASNLVYTLHFPHIHGRRVMDLLILDR